MKHLEIDAVMERRVVELLAQPQGVARVAGLTGLSFNQTTEVAIRNGYPDVAKMRASLDALRANAVQRPNPDGTITPRTARGERELREVPVGDVTPDPDNVREHLTDIEALADSMREAGLVQPIVVRRRGTALIVVAGHRRLAAAKALGWETIESVVVDDMRPSEILAQMIIENTQRRDLDPIEEARAFERLKLQMKVSSEELGQTVGRAQAYIDGRLALLALSPEDQAAVRAKQLGVTHAVKIARERAGTTRNPGTGRVPHLANQHPLASRARARCRSEHPKGAIKVGMTACGACWESVIRADEQRQALARSMNSGTCVTCEQPVAATAVEEVADIA